MHFQGPIYKPAISPKQTKHVSDTVLGGSNDVILSKHQPGNMSKHQLYRQPLPSPQTSHPAPHNPTTPHVHSPTFNTNKEFRNSTNHTNSFNNLHEFRNSLYDSTNRTNSFNNPHEFRNSPYDSTNRTNSFNNPHEFRNSLYDSTNHTNSFNNPHEFRNSLYDFHHHRASDAFQGPIYSAHKPAISPEQTNHVSHTIQEAHQMTCIITPLHHYHSTIQGASDAFSGPHILHASRLQTSCYRLADTNSLSVIHAAQYKHCVSKLTSPHHQPTYGYLLLHQDLMSAQDCCTCLSTLQDYKRLVIRLADTNSLSIIHSAQYKH
jgi:hypothetical protein